jgi:hypothetical protein
MLSVFSISLFAQSAETAEAAVETVKPINVVWTLVQLFWSFSCRQVCYG